jgi:hypothetical protein
MLASAIVCYDNYKMAIKPEPSSKSTRLTVWVLAACALAAGVVALMLAWQNAELESELNALKREKPMIVGFLMPIADEMRQALHASRFHRQPMQLLFLHHGTHRLHVAATGAEPFAAAF